jgi:hypothetical protein
VLKLKLRWCEFLDGDLGAREGRESKCETKCDDARRQTRLEAKRKQLTTARCLHGGEKSRSWWGRRRRFKDCNWLD